MKVSLSYRADQEYSATNESGNALDIDMLKEHKKAMSPTELLLSATVACAAVDIVSMIKKRRKTLVDIKGTAEGDRREEHPRKFVKVHIQYEITSPDLTDDEASKIIALAVSKYCSVAASLDPDIALTHGHTILQPA
ncbi:MAG: OsmC family protein [Bacteroidota bacterium]